METYVRYFVTQQLGTAYGRVEFDDTAGGHAMIVISSLPPAYRKFSFRLSDVAKTFSDKSTWPEMILRMAISQAQYKELAKPASDGFFDPTEPLSFTTTPWPGLLVELDDLEQPYKNQNSPSAAMRSPNSHAR